MLSNTAKNAKRAEIQKIDPMERLRASITQSLGKNPFPSKETNANQGGGLMFLNPTIQAPQYDNQESDRLKRLAKFNALGKGLGSLFQIAGVASGGDAQNLGDTTGEFVLNGLRDLDVDHRQRLREYSDQLFRTNLYNTGLQNDQFRSDQSYNRQVELNDKNYNRSLSEQEKNLKRQEEERLLQSGIDPNDPEANQKYLGRRNDLYNLDKRDKESLISSRGGANNKINPDFTKGVMKGRDIMLAQLEAELNDLSKDGSIMNEEIIKAKQEQIKTIRDLKIDPNSSMAQELFIKGQPQPTKPPRMADNMYSDRSILDQDKPKQVQAQKTPEDYSKLDAPQAVQMLKQNPTNPQIKNRLLQILIEQGYSKEESELAIAQIIKK